MESLNGSRSLAMDSGSRKMGSCSSTRAMESRSRRAIVMGATSGLGREIALELLKRGFIVGVCGRRLELLQEFEAVAPQQVFIRQIDITASDAPERLLRLVELYQMLL